MGLLWRDIFGLLMQWVLLVMAEHLKHDGLCLDVVNKRLGYGHCELQIRANIFSKRVCYNPLNLFYKMTNSNCRPLINTTQANLITLADWLKLTILQPEISLFA